MRLRTGGFEHRDPRVDLRLRRRCSPRAAAGRRARPPASTTPAALSSTISALPEDALRPSAARWRPFFSVQGGSRTRDPQRLTLRCAGQWLRARSRARKAPAIPAGRPRPTRARPRSRVGPAPIPASLPRSRRPSTSTSPTGAPPLAEDTAKEFFSRSRPVPGPFRAPAEARAAVPHQDAVPETSASSKAPGSRRDPQDRNPGRRATIHDRRHPPGHQRALYLARRARRGTCRTTSSPKTAPRPTCRPISSSWPSAWPRSFGWERVYTNGHGGERAAGQVGATQPRRGSPVDVAHPARGDAIRPAPATMAIRSDPASASRRRCCAQG